MLNKKLIIASLICSSSISAQTVGTVKDNKAHDSINNPVADTLKAGDNIHCKVFRNLKNNDRVYYDLKGHIVRRTGKTIIVSGIEPRLLRPALMRVDAKACVTEDYEITKDFEIVEISQEDRSKKNDIDSRLATATEQAIEEMDGPEIEEEPIEVDLSAGPEESSNKKSTETRSFESIINESIVRYNEVSNPDTDRLKNKLKKKVENKAPSPEITDVEKNLEDASGVKDSKVKTEEASKKTKPETTAKKAHIAKPGKSPEAVTDIPSTEAPTSFFGALKHFFFGKD